MTRKDYVAIAAAFDYQRQTVADMGTQAQQAVTDCAAAVANVMARDNPRFDCARFLKACGVQS